MLFRNREFIQNAIAADGLTPDQAIQRATGQANYVPPPPARAPPQVEPPTMKPPNVNVPPRRASAGGQELPEEEGASMIQPMCRRRRGASSRRR